MTSAPTKPRTRRVVHLELHTHDLEQARAFYAELFGWRAEWIGAANGRYLGLDLATGIGGGMVECETRRPLWLPYVEVAEISEATDTASLFGASVLLQPREGPAGWRSVVTTAAGGEVALWQPKR